MRSLFLAIALLLGVAHADADAQVILMPRYGPRVSTPFMPQPVTYSAPTYSIGSVGMPYSMFGPTGPMYLPGFGAVDPPRMRSTIHPAIYLPSREIIEAALNGEEDTRASLTIVVPESNARVFLDGVQMTQSGTRREFMTPPLDAGSSYVFQLQVQWNDDRGPHTRSRSVTITPGGKRTVYIR